MERFEANLYGVKSLDDFEVIEIVDEKNSYLALLGINWASDNNSIFSFKNRKMFFESDTLTLVAPLDPWEGERYT